MTRSASHLSCSDLEQSQAKILCWDLKQQISFCVANIKCCTLGKSKPLCHSECHSKVILCQTVQCKTKTQQAGTSHKSISMAVDISSGKLTLLVVNTSARCKLTTLVFHKLQTLVKQRRRPLKSTECRMQNELKRAG